MNRMVASVFVRRYNGHMCKFKVQVPPKEIPPPLEPSFKRRLRAGFTLVEIAIVLVIIGLIIGGILVGQDLIRVATIRSQVSQIDKYQAAINTFRLKYNNALPGDVPARSRRKMDLSRGPAGVAVVTAMD
jgi:prepilin-type N-terminal cleavage/methylation domain-containing protein